jgi:hypothetical protein
LALGDANHRESNSASATATECCHSMCFGTRNTA